MACNPGDSILTQWSGSSTLVFKMHKEVKLFLTLLLEIGKKIDPERIKSHYMLRCESDEYEKEVDSFEEKDIEKVKNRIDVKGAPRAKFAQNELKLKSRFLIPKLRK